MRRRPVETRALAWLAAATLGWAGCGFDWSLPEPAQGAAGSGGASGAGGAGGSSAASGGAGGSSIDDCTTCANRAALRVCSGAWADCQAAAGCVELTTCALGCDGDAACAAACQAGADRLAQAAFDDVVACAVCDACRDACAAFDEACE
jgi:hypothetical protein